MIPITIQCGCGQRYEFDVEPVDGQMPTTVACPVCGVDGTAAANEMIAQTLTVQAPPSLPKLRLQSAPVRTEAPPPPPPPAARAAAVAPAKAGGEFNLGLGILGAFIGALIGIGAMYGFYESGLVFVFRCLA